MDKNTNKQFRIYDESTNYIRLSVDETIARGLNKWQNWQCSAGVRALYIDFDGNVWICNTASAKLDRFNTPGWDELLNAQRPKVITEKWWPIKNQLAIDYRKTKEAFKKILENTEENKKLYPGFLGNIFEGYELPTKWFKCPWESCGCGADVILAKAKTPMHRAFLNIANTDSIDSTLVEDISDPVAVEMNFPIPFQILWDLGRKCNYDCSYCWPSVHNRTDDHKDYELLVNTTNKLIDQWANNSIRWNFGGGEPTLHPKFLDLLKHLKSRNQWTMVTSNGTRDHKYWAEAATYLNSINLSAHFDGLQDNHDEDRFIKNIVAICNHFDDHDDDHWLEIKLMAPPKYIDRALALKNKILDLNILNTIGANDRIKGIVSLVPIRGLDDSGILINYTTEQLELFAKQ